MNVYSSSTQLLHAPTGRWCSELRAFSLFCLESSGKTFAPQLRGTESITTIDSMSSSKMTSENSSWFDRTIPQTSALYTTLRTCQCLKRNTPSISRSNRSFQPLLELANVCFTCTRKKMCIFTRSAKTQALYLPFACCLAGSLATKQQNHQQGWLVALQDLIIFGGNAQDKC